MSDTATSNVVGPAAISAHEYKLVLKPNKFKGVKPDVGNNTIHDWKMLSKRWDAIRESAKDLGPISTKAKARHVEFFDSNRLLQKNNIILRQRTALSGNKAGTIDVTLKSREGSLATVITNGSKLEAGFDPAKVALSAETIPANIGKKKHLAMAVRYSQDADVKVSSALNSGGTASEAIERVPQLSGLHGFFGLKDTDRLVRVGGKNGMPGEPILELEYKASLPKKLEADVALWFRCGKLLTAEISYKAASTSKQDVNDADALFLKLEHDLAKKLGKVQSKTESVYKPGCIGN